MRYATWDVKFEGNIGTTPESIIKSNGGQATGSFMPTDWVVCGCISDDTVISGTSYWNCTEITQAQALALAGPTATLSADGHFVFPIPSKSTG